MPQDHWLPGFNLKLKWDATGRTYETLAICRSPAWARAVLEYRQYADGHLDMTDPRQAIYQSLHAGQLNTEEASNRFSAESILNILWDYMQPSSVLDVGCGLGTWLATLQSRGVKDLHGLDGPWLNADNLRCDRSLVQVCDFETGFDLGRRFDLVVCLEVAEHLAPNAAEHFVENLTKHSSAILFSAAIPFQGGDHHVNEQFLSYWIERFDRHRFQPLDIIRGRIWDDSRILWWLRQNIVLFAHKELIARSERLSAASAVYSRPISIVHPEIYLSRLHALQNLVKPIGHGSNKQKVAAGKGRKNRRP